jgi:hypothetical protein
MPALPVTVAHAPGGSQPIWELHHDNALITRKARLASGPVPIPIEAGVQNGDKVARFLYGDADFVT